MFKEIVKSSQKKVPGLPFLGGERARRNPKSSPNMSGKSLARNEVRTDRASLSHHLRRKIRDLPAGGPWGWYNDAGQVG